MRVALEIHLIDRGHQPDGIAQRAGIHVVLHQFIGDGDIAVFERSVQAAAHAHVDHQIGIVRQDHRLGAERGVDLADAALRDDHVPAVQLSNDKRAAADGLNRFVFNARFDLVNFNVHRADNANHLIHPFIRADSPDRSPSSS